MDKKKEKQIYQWLKLQQYSGKKWINFASALGTLHGLMMIGQAALLAWIISHAVMFNITPQLILLPLCLLLIVFIIKALSLWGKEVCGFKGGRLIREHLRTCILQKINAQGPMALNRHTTGQWVMLLHERVNQVQAFYSHYLPQLRMMSTLPLIIGVIVLSFNWAVGLIFLITAPLVPLFMVLVGNKAAESNRKNFLLLSRLSHHFLDRLRGLSTLRLLNRSQQEKAYVARAANGFCLQTMRVLKIAFLSSAVLEFFAAISIALTAMYLGMSYLGYLKFGTWSWSHPLTLFTGFFLLLLAPEFYQSLRDLGTHYHARAQAIGASHPIMTFLSETDTIITHQGQTFNDTSTITIVCQNLTVKSAEADILLKNLSFTIKSGENIAITGPSGSGKSTLLRTLLGFYPYEGSLTINGIELRDLDTKAYHTNIAWISQNPLIVYGSADDNVRLGCSRIRDYDVNEALNKAYAMEFIRHLPKGKHTLLGESGSRLSVGQAQRIALARALARKGKLVLLDEPTASLDKHSEKLINERLTDYTKGRTAVVATHRFNQLINADNILLMDNGKIISSGTFAELKQHSALFKQLWNEWQNFDNDPTPPTDSPLTPTTQVKT